MTHQHLVHKSSESDIERTLSKIKGPPMTCTVTRWISSALYHVFSLPFAFDTFRCVGHTCPSDSFSRVTYSSLLDGVSFEHQFSFVLLVVLLRLKNCLSRTIDLSRMF